MKIHIFGAAKVVTGSCYLIETEKSKVLVDCGMFQGPKEITKLNYEPFRFNPKEVSDVILTHAHLDHSGLLPKLIRYGFNGKIWSTGATKDLTEVVLKDTVHIQYDDLRDINRVREKHGLPPLKELYFVEDVEKTINSFKTVPYDEMIRITDDISIRLRDAGHILGSASIEMFIEENGKTKKVVFSGDIGQWNVPIIKDPTLIESADYVFIESTYGNRLHEDVPLREQLLLDAILTTFERNGKLIIPSFAIERTQELLYYFHRFLNQNKFPEEEVFVDSPLAIRAIEVFKKHTECYDKEALNEFKSIFGFPNLRLVHSKNESKKLNDYEESAIIIAGSGMCTGGRIVHHLRHQLWKKENMVLFVGYQAEGTLGREILEGKEEVEILGETVKVNSEIRKIESFSAHADLRELVKWINGFKEKPNRVFITHGEEEAVNALKKQLTNFGFDCHVPSLNEVIEL
ncbi:MAG: metallo-beta-lactamase family protein [Candidatus Woesearchaeota archaeon]|nr:metallo-beta-lactamase family protein [Candidatus Woesearchaeota archaeon]